jgi:RNA polymerase sigma-70 factor, ECF subfamily
MYLVHEGSGYSGPLEEFERIYAFIYARVGNRADAEDLTQQVAVKALPRLREGAPAPAVRAYLFLTAKSVLSTFWADRFRLPEAELPTDLAADGRNESPAPSAESSAWLEETLAALPLHYRRVLELRFLRGCSIREAAAELGKSVGAIKLMQLRALRAAGATRQVRSRPEHPRRAAVRGSAFAPLPANQAFAAQRQPAPRPQP